MSINGKTLVYGLLANPIFHTLSPVIHNTLAAACGVNSTYVPFLVESKDKLKEAIDGAFALNVYGMNVSVPYKEEILKYLVSVDKEASLVGAVNTLVRVQGGYRGYNTDISGFIAALEAYGVDVRDREVVILGAGGAARAVAVAVAKQGAKKIYILNRTIEKARQIVDMINVSNRKNIAECLPLSDYNKINARFIAIQTTSVGLGKNSKESVITDNAFFEKMEVAIDIIYEPPMTVFLKRAKENGAKVYNGLEMLYYQAVHGFKLWNPTVDLSEIKMENILNVNNYDTVILIGFMGTGKTTVGKALADKIGYSFYDTDKIIESIAHMGIPEIFATQGEVAFRDMEAELAKDLSRQYNRAIIATGGGIVERAENGANLKKAGRIVYLKTKKENILARVSDGTGRPLLDVNNLSDKVDYLLNKRNPLYSVLADVIIETDNKSVEDTVLEIIEKLGLEVQL